LARIRSEELPIVPEAGAKIVVHIFPLESFRPGFQINLEPLLEANVIQPMSFMSSGYATFHDLDGVYIADVTGYAQSNGYSAVLRNGCVEVVQRIGIDKVLPNPQLEEKLLQCYPQWLKWLQLLGVMPPVPIMVSFLDVEGCAISNRNIERMLSARRAIKQRDLLLHEVLLQKADEPAESVLRPVCDAIWQACGLQRSFNFDGQGHWKPQQW
jgi:hypothetical protein